MRELRNAIERAVARARPAEPVSLAHLPPALRSHARIAPRSAAPCASGSSSSKSTRSAKPLPRIDGNRTRAAEALGVSRIGLRQKMRRYGLEEPAGD